MKSERQLPARIAVAGVCAAAALSSILAASAAAAPAAGVAGGRLLRTPSPAVRSATGTTQIGSYNWSGYAQSAPAGTFRAVIDTWVVPAVQTGAGNQYSSDWVGIGGFGDSTLVQAGTEADNFGGTAFYRAWTEILPEPENPLSLTVNPGDKITTLVREIKPGVWKMQVTDKTTKLKASRTTAYAGSTHASVESIHERPCIISPCNTTADLAELTHTANVTFDPGKYATAIGVSPATALLAPATGATLYQMLMENNAGSAVIAAPSLADVDNDGFSVAYGSVSPPAPKS